MRGSVSRAAEVGVAGRVVGEDGVGAGGGAVIAGVDTCFYRRFLGAIRTMA